MLEWLKAGWSLITGDWLKNINGLWDRIAELFGWIGSLFEKTEQEKKEETREDVQKKMDEFRRTGRPPRTK